MLRISTILLFLFSTSALALTTFNVKKFGALGNGIKDDTLAIQRAINAAAKVVGSEVYIPAATGSYKVRATGDPKFRGLQLRANTHIRMDANATLEALANNQQKYAVVTAYKVAGVTITGGIIKGERADHKGTGGEWGHCLALYGAIDAKFDNVTFRDCWGDGIWIGSDDPKKPSKNLSFIKIKADNNRRQGMSVVAVDGLKIIHSVFTNTNGTAPESGIDIEGNSGGYRTDNIHISYCDFTNNNTSGLKAIYRYGPASNVVIEHNVFSGNPVGILLSDAYDTIVRSNIVNNNKDGIYIAGKLATRNQVTENHIHHNSAYGLGLGTGAYKNTFTRNKLDANKKSGIYNFSSKSNTIIEH